MDRLFGRLTLGEPVDEIMDQMRGPRPTAAVIAPPLPSPLTAYILHTARY